MLDELLERFEHLVRAYEGACAVESDELILSTANALFALGAQLDDANCWLLAWEV